MISKYKYLSAPRQNTSPCLHLLKLKLKWIFCFFSLKQLFDPLIMQMAFLWDMARWRSKRFPSLYMKKTSKFRFDCYPWFYVQSPAWCKKKSTETSRNSLVKTVGSRNNDHRNNLSAHHSPNRFDNNAVIKYLFDGKTRRSKIDSYLEVSALRNSS